MQLTYIVAYLLAHLLGWWANRQAYRSTASAGLPPSASLILGQVCVLPVTKGVRFCRITSLMRLEA